jgi:hypothetical protein
LGIDAGIVAYLDSSLVTELRKIGRSDKVRLEQMREAIDALLLKNNKDTRMWAVFATEGNPTSNIGLCSTGFGSGEFPSYWGFDAAGRRTCLVTDFHCLYCLDT